MVGHPMTAINWQLDHTQLQSVDVADAADKGRRKTWCHRIFVPNVVVSLATASCW